MTRNIEVELHGYWRSVMSPMVKASNKSTLNIKLKLSIKYGNKDK